MPRLGQYRSPVTLKIAPDANIDSNAVELIVSVIALVHNEVLIVQTSLIGSILSNLLLVMGMCFFFGGLNRVEQSFNVTVAQTASSMLALAVGSLIIPTAFASFTIREYYHLPSKIFPNSTYKIPRIMLRTSLRYPEGRVFYYFSYMDATYSFS